MRPATIYVNARLLGEPVTGVQRWGREVLRELDAMLGEGEIDPAEWRFVLVAPRATGTDEAWGHMSLEGHGPFRSHLWEQLTLPRHAPGPLLNLKNTAPARHGRMAVTIHDVQVFARPAAYSRRFVAWYRWLYRRLVRNARAILTVSKFSAGEIERYLGVPRDAITVTGEGAGHLLRCTPDASILERSGLAPGAYFLSVSSLNPNKNFGAAIEAASDERLAGTRLAVVGGSDPRVFRRAVRPELLHRATWLGRVSDEELLALYQGARALVYPSHYEGFGLPPVEAMAAGCPVVCSRAAALPETCGDAALYCDPGDVAGLADNLASLVEDAGLAADLAEKGRAQAARFTWRACARRVWTRMRQVAEA